MRKVKKLAKIAGWILLAVVIGATVFAVPTIWFKPWSIDHFYARVFLRTAVRRPMMLSSMRILEPMGLRFHNDDLDDGSVEFQVEEAERMATELETLRSYDREGLSADARISYDVLEWFLADQVAARPFILHDYPVNQLRGAHQRLPDFMLNTHQVNDLRDGHDYVARLRQFGRYFDQTIAGQETRRSLGIVPPRFVLDASIEQMREQIAEPPGEHRLIAHLADELEALDLADDVRAQLVGEAVAALTDVVYPAYERLISACQELLTEATSDDGVWKLPDGAALYSQQLRSYTTTDLTADQIHQLGLEAVAAIEAEMRVILESQGIEVHEVGPAMRALAADERFVWPSTDDARELILDRYRELATEADGAVGTLFNVRPSATVAVERMPEFREERAPRAYYQPPAFDGTRPGTFYVNLRDPAEHSRYFMRTLVHHEAIPGHHFERALSQERKGVPFFRRVLPFIAYGEGWGLYAEGLAGEAGLLDDPFDRLGYLASQQFRSVRLVVDTGIHAKRWSRERAIEYALAKTGLLEADVTAEIERYIVMPGQACSYKIGHLKIAELRERARVSLGDRFDLPAFHDVILGNGAVPLTILEDLVDDWIARGGG